MNGFHISRSIRAGVRVLLLLLCWLLASCGGMPAVQEEAGKRGIGNAGGAYSGCIDTVCEDFYTLGLSWAFNWHEYTMDCPGIEWLCMISNFAGFERIINKRLTGCSDVLMTFNEPELGSQANMSPDVAAQLWRIIERVFPEFKLVTPGIVRVHRPNCSWGGPSCYWLDDFYNAYLSRFNEPPRIDYMGGHCYGYFGRPLIMECREMVEYLQDRRETWGIEGGIIINEFGPTPFEPADVMRQELIETILYLEGHPAVEKYAVWTLRTMGWVPMNCMDCNSRQITAYGEVYRDTKLYQFFMPLVGVW